MLQLKKVETEFKLRIHGCVNFIAKLICAEILASKLVLVVCEGLLAGAEPMKLECLVVLFAPRFWPASSLCPNNIHLRDSQQAQNPVFFFIYFQLKLIIIID